MFYLTTHSTHFIYGYMVSDIWLRIILIVRKETRCRHIGYSFQLTARVLLYAPSHRQDSTYHSLCYTSRGALAGMAIWGQTYMFKDHTDSERGNRFPPPPIWTTLSDQQQGFCLMHHPTDRITHSTAFATPVVEHWLEREIAHWVHDMRSIQQAMSEHLP